MRIRRSRFNITQKQAQGETETDTYVTEERSQINTYDDENIKNPQTGRGYTETEKIDRFRELIQYGRQKDALEWSMKTQLWGHALLLSYKMDSGKNNFFIGRGRYFILLFQKITFFDKNSN